jgi:hypothetical protein
VPVPLKHGEKKIEVKEGQGLVLELQYHCCIYLYVRKHFRQFMKVS